MSVTLGKKSDLMPPSVAQSNSQVFYPSVYLENIEGLPMIPEEGTITFKFKRRSVSATKRDAGESTVTVTLDLTSLEDVTGAAKKRKSQVDVFDDIAKQVFSERG
jgi:hypothetical protein